ncbi:putative F-box protein At3g16210 [Apium graveolens]|uniref:putative F-box protein At3g16210 n=1 Tax=Apium graveolens TaxID=4045 RepID=UPI003D79F433
MESTPKHLPENLLMKIFLPLSTKTLLRSRCVCKLWDEVINNKFFIKSHYKHHMMFSLLDTNKYLLIGSGTSYLTALVDAESYNHIFESHEYDLNNICGRNLANYSLEAYGFCNGLICLSHAKQDLYPDYPIYLWNPVIRKAKKLPPVDIDLEYIDHSYLCFGYHDDDYKVINMVPLSKVYNVYVYSLSANSWKFLKFVKDSDHDDDRSNTGNPMARFVNGVAYFKKKDEIVSFELTSDIIRKIDLPDDLVPNYNGFRMEEYRESLAIVQNKSDNVVIWVLRVSHNSVLWDKKDVFELTMEYQYGFRAMGFMNNDKLVLKRSNHGSSLGSKYFLYNVENGFSQPFLTPEKVDVSGHNNDCLGRIYELTESLVLLDETSTPCKKIGRCSADKQNQKLGNTKRYSWKKT